MLNFEVPDLYVKVHQDQFSGRQKTLFEALETAEKDCGKDVEVKTPKIKRKFNSVACRSQVTPFRGKESIFKVPEDPPPSRMRFKNIISAAQNSANRSPKRGRWTKYSLDTVDEMSDKSNARAAFSFLQELKDRKRDSPEVQREQISLDQFKPVYQKRETRDKSIKTNFQSTKKISNESPVSSSQNSKSDNDIQANKEITRHRITLDHLESD